MQHTIDTKQKSYAKTAYNQYIKIKFIILV